MCCATNSPCARSPPAGGTKSPAPLPLIAKLERGEVFLPKYNNSWRTELESEWLSWTGTNEETTDQIDAAAYAVQASQQQQHIGRIAIGPVVVG